jgi:hypothetical protein
LRAFDILTEQVSAELRAALSPTEDGHASGAPLLDRALASLEDLNEVAEAMMRRLDELLTAA